MSKSLIWQQNQGYVSQPTSQQGWLMMTNNSVIEHAHKGAIAVKINSNQNYPFNFTSYDFAYSGGVIRATNSFFKNNRQDVEFRGYIAPNNVNNLSFFTNCEFTTDGVLKNPAYYSIYYVFMHNVVGINFYGNDFKNSTPNLYNFSQRGWGIFPPVARLCRVINMLMVFNHFTISLV